MSKAAREINVKTPGVPGGTEPDEAGDAAAVEAAASDTDDLNAADAAAPAAAGAMPPDLKKYVDEQIDKGVAAAVKTIKRAQANPGAPAVVLPDQADIDPSKIASVVLTKQGYVVPVNYGAAPAHIATQIALGTGMGIAQR